MLGEQTELAMLAIPAFSAAIAALAPPPASNTCSEPIGASMTGMASVAPKNSVVQSILDTSFNTKGRNARPSMACRFRFSVVSVSVPPIR